jgi:hypothetical protein
MKLNNFILLFCGMLLFNVTEVLAQKKNRWTDTLDYAAARGKKTGFMWR